MIRSIYIDTSVVGGIFDSEFQLYSEVFFKKVQKSEFKIVISDLLELELDRAPDHIKQFLDSISDKHKSFIEFSEEANTLAQKYLKEKVVGKTSQMDCNHIATATVNNIDVLISWNFKHIVNLNRIRGYNSINLREGYKTLEIRTPREIIAYED